VRRDSSIGEVATYVRGITFAPEDKVPDLPDALACLRTKNIQDELDLGDLIYVPAHLAARDELRLREGDILISSANSWELVGKCCWVPRVDRPTTLGGFIAAVRAHDDVMVPRYLFHWLRTAETQHSIRACARQTTNIANLSVPRFEALRVPTPPVEEQQRIADVLDKADAIRRKRREALALTDELLRATFLQMFGDPTRDDRFEHMTIGSLIESGASLVDGPFGSSLKPERYTSEGVRVIRNCNVCDDRFDGATFKYIPRELFDTLRRSEVTAQDILMTIKGTVGDVCLMPDLGEPAVLSATGTCRLRLVAANGFDPDFVVSQMVMPTYKRHILSFATGSAQPYVNLSAVRQMSLLRPPIELQREFLKRKAHVRRMIERYELGLSQTEALFAALQHRAFRGEL
jgi:type I restriction enzyme S subunit